MNSGNFKITSWALYDFANTIFSAIVLTAYFPLYFTELSGNHWLLGATTTFSMILAGIAIPFLGALSDLTGKTKKYLIQTTLYCIGFLALLSATQNMWVLLSLFILACFFYHAALVFYNSLLPVVAPPEKQGFASGLGTGLGYLGVVLVIPIAHQVDQTFGRPFVFLLAAALFLITSLPTFFFVPERKIENPTTFRFALWKIEWKKIMSLLKGLPQHPTRLFFLIGNFFLVDAINTIIFWFMVYAKEVFHPEQGALMKLLMAVNVSAFMAGLLAGYLTDRIGAMKTMLLGSAALVVSIIAMILAPDFKSFVLVSLTGCPFAIAVAWTAGRKLLIELVEAENLGSYFGLYGLTTKISVLGSLFFSIAADSVGFRGALWILVFPASLGSLFLLASYGCRKKNWL